VQFRNYRFIQIPVNAKPVVECFSPIQQFLEFLIKVSGWKRLIGTKFLPCTVDTSTTSIPDFSFRVTGTNKQRVLIRFDYGDSVWFFKAG